MGSAESESNYHRWKAEGRCRSCGAPVAHINPKTKKSYSYCDKHMRTQNQYSKKNAPKANNRVKKMLTHRRENALCASCGKKVLTINPVTEKPYTLCDDHRNKRNKSSRKLKGKPKPKVSKPDRSVLIAKLRKLKAEKKRMEE